MTEHRAVLKDSFCLRIRELSGLAVRGEDQEAELLAVGDHDYTIVTAPWRRGHPDDQHLHRLGAPEAPHESQWEAIATDATGAAFVCQENNWTVAVFSAGLNAYLHTIELKLDGHSATAITDAGSDLNHGPEGILLLEHGRVLILKQKDPVELVEFGFPKTRDRLAAVDEEAHFQPERGTFELRNGDRTALVPLRSCEIRDEHGRELKSGSDLAIDDVGRIYLLSSHDRAIYLLPAGPSGPRLTAESCWLLPDKVAPEKPRCAKKPPRAEGLSFVSENGRCCPLIGVDSHESGDNLFLLEPLHQACPG
jgi:hypothetical protein